MGALQSSENARNSSTGLNFVLIGSHSAGKHTVGNIILGRNTFAFWQWYYTTCVKKVRNVNNCLITIVRTPGWDGLKNSNKKTKDEIQESLFENGTDAFLLVINLKSKPFDGSEQKMLECLLMARVWNHTVVVFTNGEILDKRGLTIKEYIRLDTDVTELIQKCEDRYVVLYSGYGPSYYDQGKKVADAVKSMKEKNNNQRYQKQTPVNKVTPTPVSPQENNTSESKTLSDEEPKTTVPKQEESEDREIHKAEVHLSTLMRLKAERMQKKGTYTTKGKEESIEMYQIYKPAQSPVTQDEGMKKTRHKSIDQGRWKQTLCDIMQKLSGPNFERLKYYFKSIDETIPAGDLETDERHVMADSLVSHFGVNGSVTKTRDALKFIPRLDLQDTLMPYLTELGETW